MNKQIIFVILICFAVCAAENPLHQRFRRDACTTRKCPPHTVCLVAKIECVSFVKDGPGCGTHATCVPNGEWRK
uniref:Uncharacterized protein n=1 Tax=Panagrolaimus superbus TaxID=310955 RepID=A0A914YYQ7_9BILA